jgi:hypothetical protein|tara:strand:- start:4329 stop:4631 length:303 start_codon:yes stop_codon:yes gene_type:complete
MYKQVILYGLYASYVIYFITLLGISQYAPKYLENLQNLLKILIGLFLVINYNIFVKKREKLDDIDRKIVFSSGLFLLLSTSIFSLVKTKIENNIQYLLIN